MEQCSPLGWLHFAEQESKAELQRLLAQTTAELEATIVAARDEIARKDEEIFHMKDLLVVAFKERDEAHHQYQKLLIENFTLQQQLHPVSQAPVLVSLTGPGVAKGGGTKATTNAASFSSSDSENSGVSETLNPQFPTPSSPTPSSSLPPLLAATLGKQRALPEKGKLLKAVIDAGPTLETLLLAGQLPQWQQPPPQLDMIEIPPVAIPSSPVQVVQPRLLAQQDSNAGNNGSLVNNNNNKKLKRAL